MMSTRDFECKQIAFVFTSKGEKVSFKNDNIVIRLRRYEIDHGNILKESTLNLYTE